ncbi:MAG TPA: N,N-dimethylformamidase beta subunit family domain-containing protein [Acidimicrobiales bacterium]|nr:N,N-dimethylformamidase beta subunit family domain-containing protein [Acidimicrobiales bacterium]
MSLGVVALTVAGAIAYGLASGTPGTTRGAARPTGTPPAARVVITTPPTTAAAPAGAGAAWVREENARPGTRGWTVQHPSTAGQIEGYADLVSAQQGDRVRLYVSSTEPSWTATAFRMGWYGGILARAVWTSPPQPGVRQRPPVYAQGTDMDSAPWAPSLTVDITADWPPGDYLFKLVTSTGWDTYVPLTVRDDASTAPVLFVNAVTTWQAYNLWGGADLYSASAASTRLTRPPTPRRADAVSFDRPYALGNGSGDFLGSEEKLVKLAEMAGLDVSYATSIDIAERPALLLRHRVIVSMGHDEYYSTAMRDALTFARDHGVNLAFFGGNAVYRHIRLVPSALGPDREEVNYRVAAVDPVLRTDPGEVTVSWRQAPVNQPESTLLGEMYECNPVHADMVVTDPGAWVWAGTGASAGQHLAGVVGSEYDHWSSADAQPPGSGVELLADSPITCRGAPSSADFTYYVAPSGAGVIDAGTTGWVPRLLDGTPAGQTLSTVTLTILEQASVGPLGPAHPVRPTKAVGRGSRITLLPNE